MSQIWIGEFPIILGQFFWLIGVFFIVRWIRKPTWKDTILFTVFFSLGLLSHEMVLTLPLMLFGLIIFHHNVPQTSLRGVLDACPVDPTPRQPRRGGGSGEDSTGVAISLELFFMILPMTVYLILRLLIFPVPTSGQYAFQFGPDAIKSVWWYFLWLLNIPEEITYQSLFPLRIRPEFAANFPIRSLWWTIQPLLFVFIAGWLLAVRKIRGFLLKNKYMELGILWFAVGISILFLALRHKYPFLLTFALPGWGLLISDLIIVLCKGLSRIKKYVLISAFIVFWLATSWLNLRFTESTHWTVKEAAISKKLITQASVSPWISIASIIVIPPGDDGQRQASLADQLGMKIMLNNQSIRTYYGEAPGLKPPECVDITGKDLEDCMKKHRIVRIKG